MEPENDGSFSRGVFLGFHVNLPGCMCVFLLVWNLVLFFHLEELGLVSFCMCFFAMCDLRSGAKVIAETSGFEHDQKNAGHNDRFLKRHLSKALRNGGWLVILFVFHCTQLGIKKTLRNLTMAPIFSSFGMKRPKSSFGVRVSSTQSKEKLKVGTPSKRVVHSMVHYVHMLNKHTLLYYVVLS